MIFEARKIFPLVYFIIFNFSFFYGQDLPPIENISPIDYNAGNQNWAISQSEDNTIYIANNSGLLEYNGGDWNLYVSQNGSILRSVKVIDNLVYTGCYMDFGYWKENDLGNLTYYSLINKLDEPLIEDEQFWNILKFDDWILFQSLNRIYVYNTIEESFNIISAETSRARIFIVDNEIYFQKINEGVFTIENGNSKLVTNHSEILNKVIVGAFFIDKEVTFLTEKGDFFRLNDTSLTRWNISSKDELSQVNIYSSVLLNNGSFILGTISNGIIHIDKNGDLIRIVKQENGLNNNTILSILEDNDNNVWLGLDNGISIVNLNSPFSVYNDINGKLGTVYTSVVHNKHLYLGTNQGLFLKSLNKNDPFKFVENTGGQVWVLKSHNGILLCGHNNGTYVVTNDKAQLICNIQGAWDFKEINNNSNLLLQGNYSGLNVLEKKNNLWQLKNKIEGFDISSRFFEFVDANKIVVNHEYKGIFLLELDSLFQKVKSIEKKESQNYGSSIVRYNDNILFNSTNGIFRFDKNRKEFLKDSILDKLMNDNDDPVLGLLISDKKTNKLWGFTKKNITYISPGKFNNISYAERIPVPTEFRGGLGITGYESLTPLENEKYLIGTATGYIVLDLNKLHIKEHNIKINAVYKESQNSKREQLSLTNKQKLKSKENNLSFYYSVPEYDKYTEVNYQYKLEGFYNEWSNWSTGTQTLVSNLPHGDYTFKVRALIGNSFSHNEDSFSFTIKKPWYLVNYMMVLYIFGLLAMLLLLNNTYKQSYKKQRQKLLDKKQRELVLMQLESDQKLMKLKNKQLKQEIKNKNRELTISSMSIIKKNKILNRIKKELLEENNFTKNDRVIKTIDDNINSNKDWKFLEKALNNADKDFFKKIKKIHTKLTPNDLRFCAFLRLNLSSKEIAPLLNISIRSVEIKRYRLRKKMNLPHEGSLVGHILSI